MLLWHEWDEHGWIIQWTVWNWQTGQPAKSLVEYTSSLNQGLIRINKWSVLHFPQAKPSFLAGHPGFDDFSGAPHHDKTWAVQTLPKVCLMISSVWTHHFVFRRYVLNFFAASVCLPVRTTGSHFRMWPTSSTTPLSDQNLASLLAPRTLAK